MGRQSQGISQSLWEADSPGTQVCVRTFVSERLSACARCLHAILTSSREKLPICQSAMCQLCLIHKQKVTHVVAVCQASSFSLCPGDTQRFVLNLYSYSVFFCQSPLYCCCASLMIQHRCGAVIPSPALHSHLPAELWSDPQLSTQLFLNWDYSALSNSLFSPRCKPPTLTASLDAAWSARLWACQVV